MLQALKRTGYSDWRVFRPCEVGVHQGTTIQHALYQITSGEVPMTPADDLIA
jgi:hypothetical protein